MKIGIIGGGQLGMMMAEEAKRLGHSIVSLDPNPKSSITTYSDCHIAKDYNDREVIEYMNEICDVITYEFENVDLSVLKNYARKIPQKLKALEISRDRIIEKNFAISLGIQTPKFKKVMTKNDILIPSIIKTTNGGYDGKGQFRVLENSDTDQIGEIGSVSYISEELINFEYEISVVSTRDSFNEVVHFPISKNTHKNGILHTSIVDESIPSKIKEKAIKEKAIKESK